MTPDGIDLLKKAEGCPSHLYRPHDGTSGVSGGWGYDFGQKTETHFRQDWAGQMSAADMDAIAPCCGVRGYGADALLDGLAHIVIPRSAADAVLNRVEIPEYEAEARAAFPGFGSLPAFAQDALTDLVYNRGPSLGTQGSPSWDRRREMREIAAYVLQYAQLDPTSQAAERLVVLEAIAKTLEAMGDRLWPGQDAESTDLRNRRHHEAALLRRSIPGGTT